MPTGYTCMIDDNPNMTTKQWILEELIRSFDVCITLRDESPHLTEEQIITKMREYDQENIDYCQKSLNEAITNAKLFATQTDEEWKTAWKTYKDEVEQNNNESIIRAKTIADKHNPIFVDLQKIVETPGLDEFTVSIARFGMQQLTVTHRETLPYIQEVEVLETWKTNLVHRTEREIEYYTRKLAEAKLSMNERITMYTKLKEDLNKVFGESK